MIQIELHEAQARLHDMWDAVLTEGVVEFTRDGLAQARLVWTGGDGDRSELFRELAEDIGYIPPDLREPSSSPRT